MAGLTYEQWLSRGREHQREHRLVDAMQCYRRAARIDAAGLEARLRLGEVEWRLGRRAEAVAAWRGAVRADPRAIEAARTLAGALLAMGDAAGAADAAAHVLARVPDDARAALVAGIAALASGAGDVGVATARIAAALARDASLVADPMLATPLALALEPPSAAAARSALWPALTAIVASAGAGRIAAQLLAILCESRPPTADAHATAMALFEAAGGRAYGPAEHDALRRIALAVAADAIAAAAAAPADAPAAAADASAAPAAAPADAPAAAAALIAAYAELCTVAFAPAYPLLWPRRTAGSRLRVVAVSPAEPAAEASAALAMLAALPGEDFDVVVAVPGAAERELRLVGAAAPGLRTLALAPLPDETDAKRVAALDPDVLLDLAGLSAPVGPLLACRPARSIATPSDLPAANVAPLVDRADTPLGDLASLLAQFRAALPAAGGGSEVPDAPAMAARLEDAVRAHRNGDLRAALERYAGVLALQPRHAPTHYLRGIALRDSGDAEAARRELSIAVAEAPRFADARIAAAKLAQAAGDAKAAAALCVDGVAAAPESLPLLRALGAASLAANDGAAAADALSRALAIDPTDGDTHYNRGVALQLLHRNEEAARAYQHALVFSPKLASADFNLGGIFRERGATDAALLAYENAIRSEPANVAAHRALCEVLQEAGRIDEWLAAFDRFAARCPDALGVAVQALEACQHRGDLQAVDRWLDGLRWEAFRADDVAELCDNLEQLLYLLLFFDVEPELIARLARTYDAAARRVYGTPLARPRSRRPGRIRIGYVGADLRNHVMGKMVWQAVRHHDRSRFAIRFYALSAERDEWTERFAGFGDGFEVVAGLSEQEAAQRIAADDLDLLIDLSTHTRGARPGILALKPARVQITHVASAGTVGLSTIDYKLTDRRADIAESQAHQIETLLPMEGCVYPYRHIVPAAAHPFRRAGLGIAPEAVLIGAFVSPLKLSRRCLGLWREVLERVPRARLAFSPTNPAVRGSYVRIAAAGGIGEERLVFLPQGRDDAENQSRYELIDFVLDPMPFGGVNGTLEALDMGVPVVTLVGKRHGERSTFSILSALGVTATAAQSGSEYVDLAVRLASDPAFAREVRAAIRAGLARSELTDLPRHTRNLEEAYLRALRERAPETLSEGDGASR